MKTYKLFINGSYVTPISQEYTDVINPSNGKVITKVPKAGQEDVEKAISAARKSFKEGVWSKKTPGERSTILWKLSDLLEKSLNTFARLESENQGKTIKYATDSDMPFLIDNLRFFAAAARMLEGKAAQEYTGTGTSIIRKEPLGVVACIVPWNYPLFIAMWQIAPALAAGNSVIVKPASLTPLTMLAFAALAKEAGLPDGVLNIVTGSGSDVGPMLSNSPKIDMISFTGDTKTGKKIMEAASHTLKRIHLELGGKAPLIVLPDCDLDIAVQGAIVGAFWNAGQDCTAVTRVYVHQKDFKKFCKLAVKTALKFNLGNQLDKNTDMGPLVSKSHRERVEGYVNDAVKAGAKVLVGGKRPHGKQFEKGWFFEPTILINVEHHAKACQEEIFGPVLTIFPYTELNKAIQKANDVIYGLAASVYGKNINDCMKVARALEFGTVWINEHGALASEMPHGGFKQSGFGKDLSLYSLEEYMNIKHIYIDNTNKARKDWHYVVYGKP